MEIRFSDEINEILNLAREEAMRTGSYGIDIDHIFLGMLRHRKNDACEMLENLGLDIDEAKEFTDSHILSSDSIPYSSLEKIRLTKSSQRLISLAVLETTKLGESQTRPLHLLMAISRDTGSFAHEFLELKGIDSATLLAHIIKNRAALGGGDGEESAEGLTVEDYGVDLCALAASGALDPVDGREDEIERVIEVLCRRKKNNALLVGEAGVGKSAIVESLALKIAGGEIPALKGKRLLSLDIASVVAGTRYRGDFEKRLKEIIAELRSHPEIILFIDEFHTIVGAGGAQGSLDAANILKPALARGEIQCIGATTLSEFSKVVRKDAALGRRFQTVMVEPMTVKQSIYVLNVLEKKYAEYHGVKYDYDALLACARLTDRYISDRALPDKAIDAMDEAGAMVKIHCGKKCPTVTREDVAKVVSRMSGVPVSKVARDEGQKLLGMRKSLQRCVVGQEEAIDCVVRAIQRSRAGLKAPGRPIGSFLFLGSTGVGKTRLAKCIAEQLFDSEDNLVRIDMSEYSEKFTSSRLIGAPPGYVGFEEGGQLSEKVLQKPYSVVLLDEIEKAHPDIYNLLLQVLDEGRLTDGNGRTVDFRNTVIIMTSNAGTRELEEFGRGVGFAASSKNVELDRQSVLEKAVRKVFPPEFLNRVDEKVFFRPLGVEELEKIVDIELEELRQRALETGYKLSVAKALKHAVAVDSYDPSYGARPLKRAIMNRIENPVSEFIISRARGGVSDEVLTLSVGLDSDGKSTKVKVKN